MAGALCYPTCIVALSDPVVLANGSAADTVEHWMLPSKVQVRCLEDLLFDITGCFPTIVTKLQINPYALYEPEPSFIKAILKMLDL